jgi:hypothetical protein
MLHRGEKRGGAKIALQIDFELKITLTKYRIAVTFLHNRISHIGISDSNVYVHRAKSVAEKR